VRPDSLWNCRRIVAVGTASRPEGRRVSLGVPLARPGGPGESMIDIQEIDTYTPANRCSTDLLTGVVQHPKNEGRRRSTHALFQAVFSGDSHPCNRAFSRGLECAAGGTCQQLSDNNQPTILNSGARCFPARSHNAAPRRWRFAKGGATPAPSFRRESDARYLRSSRRGNAP